MDTKISPIDCACVIHGDFYSWEYVEKLYSMLTRHLTRPVRMHVYTESSRHVPAPFIKHALADMSVHRAWWHKLQLFNSEYHSGPLLYFDLDTVIVDNIDWIWELPLNTFWTVKDFEYLWNPKASKINSSIMWWDTSKFDYVWRRFIQTDFKQISLECKGDQDYINSVIKTRSFFDPTIVKSWRWQALDGGFNFRTKTHAAPKTGTIIDNVSILIFHGNPKPKEVTDHVIVRHWV